MADERHERALEAIATMLEGYPSSAFRTRLRRSLEQRLERSTVMTTRTAVPAPGVRAGFSGVTPYLMTPDVERLIAFIRQAFGAEETHRAIGSAGGTHCELRIGDSMLMLGGGIPGGRPAPRRLGLHLYVDDADAVFHRALEAGAESLGEPQDRPYGERSGFVKDPAGNYWYIATRQGPTYFGEAPRTVTPHLYVQRTAESGAPELMAFLAAAFGARLEMRHDGPDGLVMHAVVRIRGAAIEIGEGRGAGLGAPASFYLYVDDCDGLYEQGVEAGARSLHAPADQPYGDRMGALVDAWDNEWFIATHRGTP